MPGVSSAPHPLPAGTKLIEFPRTDGDQRNWPKNTTRVVLDGQVNYMQVVPLDDAASIRWREAIANGIAVKLKYPAGNYCLKDFPAGYRFYTHFKGKQEKPRSDPYLYGWKKARFRSTREFIPHGAWLLSDPNLDPANCDCKYCSGKTQKEVAQNMPPGVFASSSSPGPTGLHRRPKNKEKKKELLRDQLQKRKQPVREAKMFAAVQPKPVPITYTRSPNLHKNQDEVVLAERDQDLRAVNARTSMKLKRWYRTGELVWCALPKPIKGFDENAVIRFWPGIVEDANLAIITTPISQDQHMQDTSKGKGPQLPEDEDKPPWEITQYYNYHVQLLAVNRTIVTPDRLILPYQAYVPNSELMDELASFPAEKLDFDRELMLDFDPFPPNNREPGNFDQAVAPLGLAMQIGARLSDFWSLTDEWTFEYTQPEGKVDVARPGFPSAQPQNRPPANDPGTNSLVTAIQSASTSNSMSLSALQNSLPSTPSSSQTPAQSQQLPQSISTFTNTPSQDEMRSFQARVNGIQPAPGEKRRSLQFQGLWWGAERIWADDFVRLKVARRRLAPQGTEHIRRPSGPGEATRSFMAANGRDVEDDEPGAGDRGTFMRLEGLYVVDVMTPEGPVKEVRARGMVYELADVDWKEGEDQAQAQVQQSMSVSAPPPPRFVPRPSPLNPNASSSVTAPQVSAPKLQYMLPEPPQGFAFRPLLSDEYEMMISLCMISGRYYPKILQHPLLEDDLFRALSDNTPADSADAPAYSHLFALEGLNPGVNNSVDPTTYKGSRKRMMEEAFYRAHLDLENLKHQRMEEEADGDGDHDMEEYDQLQDDQGGNAMDVDLY